MTRPMSDLEHPGACLTCGTHAEYRNTGGQCGSCHNAAFYARREARKAQLATEPRCEVPNCHRRGAQLVSHHTLMCQAHFKRAQNRILNAATLPFGYITPSKDALLTAAKR